MQDHTLPNGPAANIYFLSYLWTLPSASRRAFAARGPTLWRPFYGNTRALLLLPISASPESLRRTFPNQSGELRLSRARARLSVNRRPHGARGRALEKNLKPRELLLLLRLVAAGNITETVTSIKVMIHNINSATFARAPWRYESDLNVTFCLSLQNACV